MQIVLFEDTKCYQLAPINQLRHTSEVISGAKTLLEKIISYKHSGINSLPVVLCRPEIEAYLKIKYPKLNVNNLPDDDLILINSRVKFDKLFIDQFVMMIDKDKDFAFITDEELVIMHFTKDNVKNLRNFCEVKRDYLLDTDLLVNLDHYHAPLSTGYKMYEHPWDYIIEHEEELRKDLNKLFEKKKNNKDKYELNIINKKGVIISDGCYVYPNSVIDAKNGNVYIGSNCIIEPNVFIKGPVYIGNNCVLRSGAALYGPVTIRNNSKINGEIASSIMHAYTNKQHSGFLGHSYICEWVNLGAGTTTSNLKNNYSKIKYKTGNKTLNTNTSFLGSVIGDHTKTAIGTLLNTGSIIGISCNLFGAGFHDKNIKAFSWTNASNGEIHKYDIEKAISTAKISMNRREKVMDKEYENILRELYNKSDTSYN